MVKLKKFSSMVVVLLTMIGVTVFFQNCADEIQLDKYATVSPSATPSPSPSPSPSPTPSPSGVPVITNAPTQMSLTYLSPMQITIQASGAGLTYAWFKNNVRITGQSSATFNIASVQESDAGTYRVEVSNSSGMDSVSIIVSVSRQANQTPPTITTQLRNSNAILYFTDNIYSYTTVNDQPTNRVTFTVVSSSSGTNTTYEWYFINSTGVIGKLDGFSGPSISFDLPRDTSRAGTYRVVVSNPYGTAQSQATLTISTQNMSGGGGY